jgi:hypothetical protein
MKRKILTIVSVFVLMLLVSGKVYPQKAVVMATAKKVVLALKNKDLKTLSSFAHPNKGVRISPYGYIDKKNDLVFTKSQIPNLLSDKKVYKWGSYDESEEPIRMNFAKYYDQFIYDYDFVKPDRINYNLKKNNGVMINNIAETYPNGIEVEFFFDGTDDRMYGSLRLVFEKLGSKYYLVGIVRDTPGI